MGHILIGSSSNSMKLRMKPKIVLIRPGIHQTDIDFSSSLAKRGFQAFLFVPANIDIKGMKVDEEVKLVRYKVYNKKSFVDYPLPKELLKNIKKIKPDIIQINEDFQPYSWISAHYCKKYNKNLVLISEKYTSATKFNKTMITLIDF